MLGHPPAFHFIFSALLLLLLAMHVYWFWLIIKIALRKLVVGKVEDMREDGGGEAGSHDE